MSTVKTSTRKPRPGQIIAVTFLDHSQGNSPLEFVVYGRLLSIDRLSLTVASWTYADRKVVINPDDRNVESYTILRSTIKSIERLAPNPPSRTPNPPKDPS